MRLPAFLLGKSILGLLGGKSTSAPGLFALKVNSKLLDELLKTVPEPPIYISGTNGKSTTAGFIASILKEQKKSFVHNCEGANLASGLVTALIKKTNLTGKVEAELPLLEIDEAVLRKVSKQNPAQIVLVTNFFRDQLDRFGEMETTIKLVQEGLNFIDGGTLITNADDPNTCHLKAQNTLYFGISQDALSGLNKPEIFADELANCPGCDADLKYKNQWLGQFGEFHCENCNYKKPKADILVQQLEMNPEGSKAVIVFPNGNQLELAIPLPGLFNVYNALAASAVAYQVKIPLSAIQRGIKNYKTIFGRSETVNYKGKKLKIFLIKNPIGASEVLRLISTDQKAKVLVAINDNYADGRDVSWLWDAYFEYLKNNKHSVYATGTRGSDIAVRLKYARVENIHYYANLKQALNEFVRDTSGDESNLYVLPTYTALLEITKWLG